MHGAPFVYGLLDKTRIEIVQGGMGFKDFFSVKFGEEKATPGLKTVALIADGRAVVHEQISSYNNLYAGFDIIAIPFPSPIWPETGKKMFPEVTTIVQVKSNRKPTKIYMQTLNEIKFPDYVRKELHIWHDGITDKPEIIIL